MPTIPPQIDPAEPLIEDPAEPLLEDPAGPFGDEPQQGSATGQPLTFVPHERNGRAIAAPAPLTSKIRTNRYGDLDQHELIKLLDTIEDERARGRFRESVYISVFVWLVIAWVVLYGPKYLWHAPQLISPVDVLKHRQMVELNAPVLRHPVVQAPPKVDTRTLERLRAAEPRPVLTPTPPPAPVPTPQPAAQPAPQPASSAPALPSAPAPVPARPTQPIVADAPTPQPATRPNFTQPGTASDEMRNAVRDAARGRSAGGSGVSGGGISAPGGALAGGGVEVLSDMQGVDFSEYLKRLHRDTLRAWIPLLPQETESPLFKKGDTYIILTILPDGTIGDVQPAGSSHDEAIDRAAWNSITSQGKFQPLPSQFHGPNLVLRFHYVVNGDVRER